MKLLAERRHCHNASVISALFFSLKAIEQCNVHINNIYIKINTLYYNEISQRGHRDSRLDSQNNEQKYRVLIVLREVLLLTFKPYKMYFYYSSGRDRMKLTNSLQHSRLNHPQEILMSFCDEYKSI